MKATTPYNDLLGSAAADIALKHGNPQSLSGLEKYFNLDTDRFGLVGISVTGTKDFSIALICVDKARTTEQKEFIVQMKYDIGVDENILNIIFQKFQFVLYQKHDQKYRELTYDESCEYSSFHNDE